MLQSVTVFEKKISSSFDLLNLIIDSNANVVPAEVTIKPASKLVIFAWAADNPVCITL